MSGLSIMRAQLGLPASASDERVKSEWAKRTEHVCKPCWELKYCPYGPLVEQFPLPGPTRQEAIEHNEWVRSQLAAGSYDEARKTILTKLVEEFDPCEYPESHDNDIAGRSCSVFGHLCPVFFVNEPFTETSELRRIGRSIPTSIVLRVARRDHNQCQVCGRSLRDDEIEFDHIIPIAEGGSSEEHNLRVTCQRCNRQKGKNHEL